MKKFENILLLSDMDGTLLNSKEVVSKENQEAVKYFIDEGGLFGIATGRSQINSVRFLDEIRVNAPCILYNGCGVYDFLEKQFVILHELSKNKLRVFLEYCLKEFPDVSIQVYCPEMCYIVSPESKADSYFVSTHQPCEFRQIDNIIDLPWIKILLYGKFEILQALNDQRVNFMLDKEINWVFSSETFLEFLPYGVNKGSALLEMRKKLDRKRKVYAVGDYNNDIEMLRLADVGIATKNAIPSLKKVADIITVSNDENAIADIIYNILS